MTGSQGNIVLTLSKLRFMSFIILRIDALETKIKSMGAKLVSLDGFNSRLDAN